MAGIFSFTCSCCGELHEGSPSFGFQAPDPWLGLTDAVKQQGKIGSDLCYYTDDEGTHYFVRVILEIPIHGIEEPFTWGVWVSLSQKSYEHYVDTWDHPDITHGYFGWLCSALPYYENTYAMAMDVHPQANGARPDLTPHAVDHDLYHDFVSGISIERAQTIAEAVMHR